MTPAPSCEHDIHNAAAAVQRSLPQGFAPQALVTLGTGLNDLANAIESPVVIPYALVPGMKTSTAPGHQGCFVAGYVAGAAVLCMQGRLHPYEGYEPADVALPIRVARCLGAQTFVVTNASGGINTAYQPGQVVSIADHINLTGRNPLVGPNNNGLGTRFPDMTHAYSPRLRALAREIAAQRSYPLAEGVYLGVSGPSFETPAEIHAFRTLGADLVGMSTIWEVIAAVHCGFEVVGFSLVTNMAAGILDQPITSEEVNRAAHIGADNLQFLVTGILESL